ncbi:hypothetical protein [Kitasatospora purpeofusca]|uniref:hypothetical protein n=1 Tax=Kitasatospora purpeofusca TaxID=67352 RepID=UPI002A5A7311|nr:hypothetical protein [Kitasatospora purpeofusca]MDY0812655.1 hypothetical protein [Kitasatospora purpeofusca]
MAAVDSRRVQTAVIGDPDSDRPVIAPEEPHNLDEFRRHFGTDQFWCGTHLGGCGEKLMTKRYEWKVCHFSHYPDRDGSKPTCHRRATGVESADHLFIKRDVKAWLADQGHLAQADLRSLGHGPGDAVDFWLRATEQQLRFALHPGDYRNWRRAVESLGAKTGRVEWVFGQDGVLVNDMVARRGYALRVRCQTQGTDRRVLIGLVTASTGAVPWAPLESCRMTGDGLIPPALAALRAEGSLPTRTVGETPFPASLPLRGAEVVFAVDTAAAPPAASHFGVPGRYLVAAFVKAAASRIVRSYVSLPDAVPAPTEQYVYRLNGVARLLVDDLDASGNTGWAVRADGLTRLSGLEAERTGLWRPEVALEDPVPAGPPTSAPSKAAPIRVETGSDDAPRSPLAELLRQVLIRVARAGESTSWEDLSHRAHFDLSHLPDPKRRSLLVEVDRPLHPDRAPLCVLVQGRSGRVLPYLRTVLRQLNADIPVTEAAFQHWCERAVRATHDHYRSAPTSGAAPHSRPDDSEPSEVRELRRVLREAQDLRPRTQGRRAERLATAIQQAEQQLHNFETARARGVVVLPSTALLKEFARVLGHTVQAQPTATHNGATLVAGTTVTGRAGAPDSGGRRARPGRASGAADIGKGETARRPDPIAETKNATGRGQAGVPAARQADHPSSGHADRAADLVTRFERAKAADDVSAATGIREESVRALGAPGVPDPTTKTLRRLLRNLHKWIGSREAGDILARIRSLLENARRSGENGDELALRSDLAHARILRRKLIGGVPRDLQELFEICSPPRVSPGTTVRVVAPEATVAGPASPLLEPGDSAPPVATTLTATDMARATPEEVVQNRALPEAALSELAEAVERILRDVARHQSTITWSGISRRLKRELPRLDGSEQRELLARADRATPADEPLLSALVVRGDHTPTGVYREVAAALSRELPQPQNGLQQHWQMDVLRLHSLWRHR